MDIISAVWTGKAALFSTSETDCITEAMSNGYAATWAVAINDVLVKNIECPV